MSMAPIRTATAKASEAEISPCHRMIYLKIRLAEVRAELGRLVEERKALQIALRAEKN